GGSGWRQPLHPRGCAHHHPALAARAAAQCRRRLQRRLRQPPAFPPRHASFPSGTGRRSRGAAAGIAAASTSSFSQVDQPMNDSSRVRPLRTKVGALALIAVVSAATTAVVLPQATAQSAATSTPAPQLVQGLPDFTNLVARVGPAVVNIEAT